MTITVEEFLALSDEAAVRFVKENCKVNTYGIDLDAISDFLRSSTEQRQAVCFKAW
jgi:hypothetical protein